MLLVEQEMQAWTWLMKLLALTPISHHGIYVQSLAKTERNSFQYLKESEP